MINEGKLNEYYGNIANKLDEIIPVDWKEIVLYAVELGDTRTACFYYKIHKNSEYHYSGNIPDEFNVDLKTFLKLLRELSNIIKGLWGEFPDEKWFSMTFKLDSGFKFKVEFSYEVNLVLSDYERKVRWAYDVLGIEPNDEFGQKILGEYMEEK